MIVHGGLVVTMDSADRVFERGDVRIVEGRIAAVSGARIPPERGEEIVDAEGMIVMPGLVNTHTHLFQTLLRAVYDELPLEAYLERVYGCGLTLSYEDCRIAARLGALEALLSGTTTVADHHFLNRGTELAQGTIDGMLEAGVRAVVARTIMDEGDSIPSQIKELPARGLQSVDELLRTYSNRISAGELTLMTGPNTPGINASEAACRESALFARDRRLRRSAHVAEYAAVRRRVLAAHGVEGVVRWLDGLDALGPDLLAVHAVHVDEGEVQVLADRGVAVSHNPFSNLFCGPEVAPIGAMLERGITVGLGTDGAANNAGQGVLDVMRITRLLERSRTGRPRITSTRALRMATIDGARALGLHHLVGSIEEGKLADIIVVPLGRPHMVPMLRPLDHLATFAKGSDVRIVIVGGRVIVHEGAVLTVDLEGSLKAAQEAAARLVTRLERV